MGFPKSGSAQPQTSARCQTRIACVGSVTLLAGRVHVATTARRLALPVPAAGYFNIPPHKKRTVKLTLTALGKKRLHRGASCASPSS